MHQGLKNSRNSGLRPVNLLRKGENCPSGRRTEDHRFLRFTVFDLYQLPGERENGNRASLRQIIGPIQRRIVQ